MAKSMTLQESRWVGRVLRDKWRIDRRIARGGMGTVYAATHKNNGSVAAIKVLHPEFSRDPDTRSRFLQEGYAANQVNHAGVVRILDDDMTEDGLAFLVMELLEGELLEQRRIRKGGRLPLAEVYEIGDQLLDVLAAAHAKEIVHRDIKPDNIFLTKEGRLKVLDFGFAQMKSSFRSERTATGFLLGTPGFMAPEQAVGNRPLIDAQTDVWAVGATLFLLLTGEPVHHGESAAEMLIAAANYPARSVASLEPKLPSALVTCVDRALAFDKADRWTDARSMQTALRVIPGRPANVEPVPDRARWGRSIPDTMPTEADVEDTTMMPGVPASAWGGERGGPASSWGGERGVPASAWGGERGVPASSWGGERGIPRLEYEIPDSASAKTTAFMHPADAEQATVAAVSGRVYTPPEQAAAPHAYADLAGGAEPTIIMDARPGGFGAPPRASVPDGLPAAHPAALAPYAPVAPVVMPDEIPTYRTGAVPGAAEPRSALQKALVLLLIGGITMVVVILTGLVVILGSD